MTAGGVGHRAFGVVSAILTIMLLSPTSIAQADCPLNNLRCMSLVVESTAPRDAINCSGPGPGSADAAYDLSSGTLSAGSLGFDQGASATVTASDEYRLRGTPPGLPITLTAELRVTAHLNTFSCRAGALVFASLQEGSSSPVSATMSRGCGGSNCACSGSALRDTVLRVTVDRALDEVFTLTAVVRSSIATASSSGYGRLSFAGLPPGAFVESCQGYRQDAPVPAKHASWGTLKVHYR